jgi:branched-chain amino acid transport system permease protein
MVIIGGMGSLPGAVIGAVLLSFLPEIVRPLAEYRMLIYGILLIILIIFMPKGIISLIRKIPRFKIFWFLLGSAEKNVDKHNTVAP